MQESAEGVVGDAVGRASEVTPKPRGGATDRPSREMTERPNDWKRQIGLATHEWKAAEDPVRTGPGAEGSG